MSHLYPLSVYACPNGHDDFYSYAGYGAVCWSCPTCDEAGARHALRGREHQLLACHAPGRSRGSVRILGTDLAAELRQAGVQLGLPLRGDGGGAA